MNGRIADLMYSDFKIFKDNEECDYLVTTDEDGHVWDIWPTKVVFDTDKRYGFIIDDQRDYVVEFYETVNPF